MKTISKGLILALVIQFALVLPFVNIVGVEKSKAEEPGPVTPSEPRITLVATDTNYGTIRLNADFGAGQSLSMMFTGKRVIETTAFSSPDYVPSYGRPANSEDVISLYELTSPNVTCSIATSTLKLYLVATKYTGGPSMPLYSGIYTLPIGVPLQFYDRLPQAAFNDRIGSCRDMLTSNPNAAATLRTANANGAEGYINNPINLQLPEGERITRCNSLESRWERFKTKVRELMYPAPTITSPLPGGTVNPYWTQSTGVNIRWLDLALGITRIFPDVYAYDTTIDFNLTTEGERIYDEIATLVDEMKNDVTILSQAYPENSWPDGCTKLLVFKWDEGFFSGNPPAHPLQHYSSLNAFNTDFQKVYELFKQYIESRDEPISTGDTDACGNMGAGMINGKIFQWLFCELANIIHGIAAKIMTKATEWLTASIGVDIVFKPPAEDEVPTGGGGTDTPAPGTENPTPAPGTAVPMNISGTLEFRTENEYNRAKGDGGAITVKVKNNNAAGAIINVGSAISWGTWESTQGRVSCRFTTTENIPAEWTSVKIYSEDASGNLRFRFSINYPPAGNTFTAISSIE